MYKIKDLAVKVLPADKREQSKACLLGTRICLHPTDPCRFRTIACLYPTDACRHYITDLCHRYQTFCRFPTNICNYPTIDCFKGTIECPFGTIECGITIDPCGGTIYQGPIVIDDVAQIDDLRKELQETIQRLDELEEAGLESAQFTSAEEVEELEQRLQEALDEVRRQKKNL